VTRPLVAAAIWLFYVLAFALHGYVRAQADNLGPPAISPSAFEHWLFRGTPSLWLQAWTPETPAVQWLAVVIHASWFYGPVLLGIFVHIRLGSRAVASLMALHVGVAFSADAAFMLMPAKPPWMDFELQRIVDVGYGDTNAIDRNPVAALPSLHVALPAAYALWFRAQGSLLLSRLSLMLWGWTAAIAWSVVYGGEHYMVDVMAGVIWAVGVFLAYEQLRVTARRIYERMRITARENTLREAAVR
jgi:hypothetical protein